MSKKAKPLIDVIFWLSKLIDWWKHLAWLRLLLPVIHFLVLTFGIKLGLLSLTAGLIITFFSVHHFVQHFSQPDHKDIPHYTYFYFISAVHTVLSLLLSLTVMDIWFMQAMIFFGITCYASHMLWIQHVDTFGSQMTVYQEEMSSYFIAAHSVRWDRVQKWIGNLVLIAVTVLISCIWVPAQWLPSVIYLSAIIIQIIYPAIMRWENLYDHWDQFSLLNTFMFIAFQGLGLIGLPLVSCSLMVLGLRTLVSIGCMWVSEVIFSSEISMMHIQSPSKVLLKLVDVKQKGQKNLLHAFNESDKQDQDKKIGSQSPSSDDDDWEIVKNR
ncbi:hypothetical protein N9Y17_00695 [Gammaproteobacteria bacterium]|nr:hypothetical protein [Gammaproteobacteria bacterium]